MFIIDISLPDISKWNTKKIKYIYGLFYKYENLLSLPDISKWNTSEIVDILSIFEECFDLFSIPDFHTLIYLSLKKK